MGRWAMVRALSGDKPKASVREHAGKLYAGSVAENAVAVLELPPSARRRDHATGRATG